MLYPLGQPMPSYVCRLYHSADVSISYQRNTLLLCVATYLEYEGLTYLMSLYGDKWIYAINPPWKYYGQSSAGTNLRLLIGLLIRRTIVKSSFAWDLGNLWPIHGVNITHIRESHSWDNALSVHIATSFHSAALFSHRPIEWCSSQTSGASLPQIRRVMSSSLWSAAHHSPVSGLVLWRFLTSAHHRNVHTQLDATVPFGNQSGISTLFPPLLYARSSISISWATKQCVFPSLGCGCGPGMCGNEISNTVKREA